MKCSEFQKIIPDIVKGEVPDEKLCEILEHIEECPDCKDELEIYYVLNYGLSDDADNSDNMDFIERLNVTVRKLARRYKNYVNYDTFVRLVGLCMYTAIAGSFIYVLFQFLL